MWEREGDREEKRKGGGMEGWVGKMFGNWARVRKKQEGNRKLSLEPNSQEWEATPDQRSRGAGCFAECGPVQ
jgi:hypothetical protein